MGDSSVRPRNGQWCPPIPLTLPSPSGVFELHSCQLFSACLDPGRRERELPLDLAAVQAVEEVDVVPAPDPQVDAAHVRAVPKYLGETGAPATPAGFDHLDHFPSD